VLGGSFFNDLTVFHYNHMITKQTDHMQGALFHKWDDGFTV